MPRHRSIVTDSIIEGDFLYYQESDNRVFLYRLSDAEQVWIEVDADGSCRVESPLVPLPVPVADRLREMLNLTKESNN